ncbi:MAG: phospho-N-acetylmuramoyl-pentapeptide-transferase [Psittacicella sp.]
MIYYLLKHGLPLVDLCFLMLLSTIITSFIFLYFGIKIINNLKLKQSIRESGPKTHLLKIGTPTMGGVPIILSVSLNSLFWIQFSQTLFMFLFVFVGFGLIGFLDDFLKVFLKNPQGLRGKYKYFLLSVISIILLGWIYYWNPAILKSAWIIPFFGKLSLGFILVIGAYFVLLGTSNGVNLTDGLDGLVSVPVILSSLVFIIIAILGLYCAPIYHLSSNFYNNEIIVLFLTSIIGSLLVFLWFNSYPAKIFMGDVGSLPLGGVLALSSILMSLELLLVLTGIIFVIEACSVMIQLTSKRLFKRKVFKMAPIHHHFEIAGHSETKVIMYFWIVSVFASTFGIFGILMR